MDRYVRIFAITVICCLFASPLWADDFPVGVFHDPISVHYFWNLHDPVNGNLLADSLANRYISEIKEFGIDFMLGPLVPHTAQLCEDSGIELIVQNEWLGSNTLLKLTNQSAEYLEYFIRNSCYFDFEPNDRNDDSLYGYRFIDENETGTDEPGTTRRYADVDIDDPGYLFRLRYLYTGDLSKEGDSLFWAWEKSITWTDNTKRNIQRLGTWDNDFTYNDSLNYHRLNFILQYENEVCSANGVIAEIRAWNPYYRPYRLTIYNDTLIYDEDGDTIRIDDQYLTWGFCDTTIVGNDTTIDCFTNGLLDHDTLWGYVWDSKKIIHPSDFSAESTWDTISCLYFHYPFRMGVYWHDSADVYIDKCYLMNRTSQDFYLANGSIKSDWKDSIDARYTSLGLSGSVNDVVPKWFPLDEIPSAVIYPMKHGRELLGTSVNNSQAGMMFSKAAWAKTDFVVTSNVVGAQYMPDYPVQVGNIAGLSCNTSQHSSTNSDDTCLQVSIDSAISQLSEHHVYANIKAQNFYPILQDGGAFPIDPDTDQRYQAVRQVAHGLPWVPAILT